MRDALPIVMPVLLGGLAVYLLLPRPKPYSRLAGAALGVAALVLAGLFWLRLGTVSVEGLLFYAFAGIAILSGVAMIAQSNPARAALSFALVVLSSCGLFLLQAAPFLMAATTIIYAGAVIVTFLFVLMLAQQEGPSDADQRSREPELATAAGGVLLIALLFVLLRTYDSSALDQVLARAEAARQHGDPAQALGDTFFEEMNQALRTARGGRTLESAEDELMNLEESWRQAKQPAEKHKVLDAIVALATQVRAGWGDLPPDPSLPLSTGSVPSGKRTPQRDARGKAPMPAENVAAVGRSLFSDYLLAVELAGMLLTVATIGAIVIAGRKSGQRHLGAIS